MKSTILILFFLCVCCRSAAADRAVEAAIAQANAGDPVAQFRLAGWYYGGRGVPQDYTEARKWYERVAEGGSEWTSLAQHSLARMYELGRGVPKDLARAFRYYEQSAENGFGDAQYYLACAFESGVGVGRDLEKANRWFREAVEVGYGPAMAHLGINLAKGRGAAKDPVQAFVWLTLALPALPREIWSEDVAVLRASATEALADVDTQLTQEQKANAEGEVRKRREQFQALLRAAKQKR